jgi:hypothetical protein
METEQISQSMAAENISKKVQNDWSGMLLASCNIGL